MSKKFKLIFFLLGAAGGALASACSIPVPINASEMTKTRTSHMDGYSVDVLVDISHTCFVLRQEQQPISISCK